MIRVKRANVILDIAEQQQSEYLAKGFDVVDDKGNILIESLTTNDPSTLHKKLMEAHEKIKALEQENKLLKEKLNSKAKSEDKEDFVPINQRKAKNTTKK